MRFYTSDLHLGHKNIIDYCDRPFPDVQTMGETLVENWNSVVKENDEVYVLGDLIMGKFQESTDLCRGLKGDKYLVPGNHDKCWSGHSKVRPKDFSIYEDAGFMVLEEDFMTASPAGTVWRVCHFPYEQDERHGDRFAPYHPVKTEVESLLLHGHVHQSWKWNGEFQLNVGVDVWDYYPVAEDDILNEIMVQAWLPA